MSETGRRPAGIVPSKTKDELIEPEAKGLNVPPPPVTVLPILRTREDEENSGPATIVMLPESAAIPLSAVWMLFAMFANTVSKGATLSVETGY